MLYVDILPTGWINSYVHIPFGTNHSEPQILRHQGLRIACAQIPAVHDAKNYHYFSIQPSFVTLDAL